MTARNTRSKLARLRDDVRISNDAMCDNSLGWLLAKIDLMLAEPEEPAPSEAEIDDWSARLCQANNDGRPGIIDACRREGVAMLRRAAAAAPDDLGVMRDAAGLSKRCQELRDRIVADAGKKVESEPAAGAAGDAEIEAAITEVDSWSQELGEVNAYSDTPISREETQRIRNLRDEAIAALRALIARRVAEARGAGLRELRVRLVDFCRIRDRGYDVRSDFSPLWVLDEIDRLLAAPAASKLAEEPAQEDDGPCLSALLANMRMEMSDGANGMRTPREEAIAAVVECVARRIEALERAAQGGDK